ncbi:MAG: alanine--tRNA ligase [Planctomycetes bacterium]|nr:alanine--tRNA ligase [Planctomycetota bacterium]
MTHPRTAAEIREAFLSFFEERGHVRMPSDSLIPSNDPTLLFTGAGMNQFKNEFLGKGRDLQRATTSQKCLRVPDLENVGATPRHHTFFEMLGNFSFGDYFKHETIPWEWTFFTEVLGWDPDRFVCTVYTDDDESFAIWNEQVGIPAERIYRFGEKENFWPSSAPSKGPNGPCGPCSELYYDQEPGQPLPENAGLEELPGRFLEVGNFVFTQYNRQDGGKLEPLPQKNIDVGLGLERVAAVAQGVANNFETDLFAPILSALQEGSGRSYGSSEADDVRMRRIADHARAVFFCIADGAAPGREGRGYVVRKILRRAIRDGIDLGFDRPFLASLLPAIQETMGAAYPQLHEQADTIQALCAGEEQRFREVYRRGVERLEQQLDQLAADGAKQYPGELAFELHDTFGFPVDITEVVARDRGFAFDQEGFESAMESQRDRARAGTEISDEVFAASVGALVQQAGATPTVFLGYDEDSADGTVQALLVEGQPVSAAQAGQDVLVVLDRTPFYAEGGGQIGDRGTLNDAQGQPLAEVQNARAEDKFTVHQVRAHGSLQVGDIVQAAVDVEARRATERHHTATHLLHAALKDVLGAHVNQAGSAVGPERLRFDYTHPEAPSAEQLREIEDLVLAQIMRSTPVGCRHSSLEEAKQSGVTALFGEKYGDEVRIIEVPGFSAELCGGTHVANVGCIGGFRVLSDRALAAGVRRIEAVAGEVAAQLARQERALLSELESELKSPADRLLERVQALKTQLKEAKQAKVVAAPDAASVRAGLEGDATFGWSHLADLDAEALRTLSDGLRAQKELPAVVVLTGGDSKKVPFVVLCRPESGHHAGKLAKAFGKHVRGGGGGRPDFAQGQGSQGDGLDAAFTAFRQELGATSA